MSQFFDFDDSRRREFPALVSTSRRVFFCFIDYRNLDPRVSGRLWYVRRAVSARYWGTTRGVAQLAHTGPTGLTRLDDPTDLYVLEDVQVIRKITDEALAAWETACA